MPLYENNTQGWALQNFYTQAGIGNRDPFSVTTSNVPQAGGGAGQVRVAQLAPGIWRCSY